MVPLFRRDSSIPLSFSTKDMQANDQEYKIPPVKTGKKKGEPGNEWSALNVALLEKIREMLREMESIPVEPQDNQPQEFDDSVNEL